MRSQGISIPAKIRIRVSDLGRDVTAGDFISAVSLLCGCEPRDLSFGPARSIATPPLSVLSPNVPGSRDTGLGGRGIRRKDGQRDLKPRRSSSSSPCRREPQDVLGVRCCWAPPPRLPHV